MVTVTRYSDTGWMSRPQVRERTSAAAIQATWRMVGDRRRAVRLRAEKHERELGQAFATTIQAAWWGYRDRVRTREIRAARARKLLQEARVQARRELSAILIQSYWRSHLASVELSRLRRERDELLALERRRQQAAVLIQSLARMRGARTVLAQLKARRDRELVKWDMTVRVQAAWRGSRVRTLVLYLRFVKLQERRTTAATVIQSFWRAVRARHLTAIQRAMFKVRQMQGGATRDIQRVYRGFKGRLRAKAKRMMFESDLLRDSATMKIQRVYRGHKGREWFECKQHLRGLEAKIRPLQDKLDELTTRTKGLSERLRKVQSSMGPMRSHEKALREELYHIKNTKDKYTDSDKINGIRQRFLTKFLEVRLVELQRLAERKLDALQSEVVELEVLERRNMRLMRQTERELLPLGMGTVEKVKVLRCARLRKKVRSEKAGATSIQRVFRGWRVRSAVSSCYRSYWVEAQDDATGDVYYVNTWNHEVRWVKPLEMSLFEHSEGREGSRHQGASSASLDDAEDYLRGDHGTGVIGGRFRQRLRLLTAEAFREAEDEARSLRLSAAEADGTSRVCAGQREQRSSLENQGGSWKQVTTDRGEQHTSPSCWFNTSTSEYYWGNEPPVSTPAFISGDEPFSSLPSDSAAETRVNKDVGGSSSFSFRDRASGEAWLKRQDIPALLSQSEVVQMIGSVGWQQMRVRSSSTSSPDCVLDGGHSKSTAGDKAKANIAEQATYEAIDSVHEQDVHASSLGSKTLASPSTTGTEVERVRPQPITFFYHAETKEARWSLSPRSSLEIPRAHRTEAQVPLPAKRGDAG